MKSKIFIPAMFFMFFVLASKSIFAMSKEDKELKIAEKLCRYGTPKVIGFCVVAIDKYYKLKNFQKGTELLKIACKAEENICGLLLPLKGKTGDNISYKLLANEFVKNKLPVKPIGIYPITEGLKERINSLLGNISIEIMDENTSMKRSFDAATFAAGFGHFIVNASDKEIEKLAIILGKADYKVKYSEFFKLYREFPYLIYPFRFTSTLFYFSRIIETMNELPMKSKATWGYNIALYTAKLINNSYNKKIKIPEKTQNVIYLLAQDKWQEAINYVNKVVSDKELNDFIWELSQYYNVKL